MSKAWGDEKNRKLRGKQISKAKKGIKFSDEVRRRMSLGRKRYWARATDGERHKVGKILNSPNSREKIRKAAIGRKVSAEVRKNKSDAKIGHEVSLETRMKISEKAKIRWQSQVFRKKMRQIWKEKERLIQ